MTRKRQPNYIYELARTLHAEGKSLIVISLMTGLGEEQIKRATDPEHAAAQQRKYARRTVLRKRGVKNPR